MLTSIPLANSPTNANLDAEIAQWSHDTTAKEVWYVEPAHHVPKVEDAVDVAIVSHFTYEFSMVALGHMSLYHRINRDGACPGVADRIFVYQPLADENGRLKPNLALSNPLRTFERRIPLKDIPLICVSLTNPDAATVALQLLQHGGVPLNRKERAGGAYPIVLAGGPGCCNPEPFADYFDMFCIGDGAELTARIVKTMYQLRRSGEPVTAESIQYVLKDVHGLYVPSLYNFSYAGSDITNIELMNGAPTRVQSAVDPPQEASQCSLVSNGEVAVIVPNYGCKHRCAYCQISEINYREFEVAPLLDRVRQYIAGSVKTLIVNSATLTQHSDIYKLLSALASEIKNCGREVKVYIGSVRFDEVSAEVLSHMSSLQAFSHTYLLYTNGSPVSFMALAPEHGSRDLMRRLKRPVDPWNVLNTIKMAADEGIYHFVLYFIVGFESETREDRDEISALACAILDEVHEAGGGIILKVNPLIPTPGTACQRMAMPTVADYHFYIEEVKEGIIRRIGHERFERQVQVVLLPDERLNFEAIINRADRRIGPLLQKLTDYRTVGREPDEGMLRTWLEDLDLSWESLTASRSAQAILPWQAVDITSTSAERQVLSAVRPGEDV
jgi:radical SAM superfamily enzyme YgiQ (UPF0313 family)